MFLLRFYSVISILQLGLSQRNDLEYQVLQYVNLASAIQGSFRSSSVFIVNAGNYEDLLETMMMAQMWKEFSSNSVLSQNMNFSKLHQEYQYYNGKTVQPLFVVMLRTMADIYQFSLATKPYNMALHTWLVIFMQSTNEEFNEYCQKPRVNWFNLVVSTRMLVKCHNDALLREWYSLDSKTVELFDYGTWEYKQPKVTTFSDRNFYERRSDFKGIRLKVSAVQSAPGIPGQFSAMDGFFGHLLKELARMMNFKIDFVSIRNSYGKFNESQGVWTGVIGQLIAHEIDIGVGEFSMTRQRSRVVDFTIPLMLTPADIFMKKPNMSSVAWTAYVKAFNTDLWMIIMTTVIIAPIFLAVIWKFITNSSINYHLMEEYLRIWGIYCQKPLSDFPESSSLRIAYISIFMSSLVLFAVYSAYLTSYLTIFLPSIPFNTYEGFVADGTYKLIALRQSFNHELFTHKNNAVFSKMGSLLEKEELLPYDIYSAIKKVCNERAVIFTNLLNIEKLSQHSPCELISLTPGRLENIAYVLTKDSPYTEIINYNLKNLRAFGIIECLRKRFYKKFLSTSDNYLPVALWSVIPVLGILFLGIAVSLFFLICECAFSRKHNFRGQSTKIKVKSFDRASI